MSSVAEQGAAPPTAASTQHPCPSNCLPCLAPTLPLACPAAPPLPTGLPQDHVRAKPENAALKSLTLKEFTGLIFQKVGAARGVVVGG